MKKRLLGLLLVVTLLLSVAAGCGSGKSDTAYDSKSTAVSGAPPMAEDMVLLQRLPERPRLTAK